MRDDDTGLDHLSSASDFLRILHQLEQWAVDRNDRFLAYLILMVSQHVRGRYLTY
jgi:hypothetical protein